MKYQKYIGIPYDKANCADLALMIQENEYGKIYDSYERPENKTPFCLSKHLKKKYTKLLRKNLFTKRWMRCSFMLQR